MFRPFHPTACLRSFLAVWTLTCLTVAAEEPFEATDLTPAMRAEITEPPAERTATFANGEKLVYRLGWGFFDVGEAVLVSRQVEINGEPAILCRLEARTNGFADAFYQVRNQTKTWLDPAGFNTLYYENIQNEGSTHRLVNVRFDLEAMTARYANTMTNDVREPVSILENTVDPLGITFYVRTLPLEVGDRLVIPTTNGKEFFLTYIKVEKRVTRKFKIGRETALVLKPDVKDIGGVFERRNDSSITFWLSDDDRKVPLRMESSVAVGSFWAELVSIEKPDGSTILPDLAEVIREAREEEEEEQRRRGPRR